MTLVPLPDLLRSVAAGDRSAFKQLYDQTSAKMFGIVLRIVKNRQQAEDVLQDIYLKIWQKAASYNPDYGSPISWMATIARNRSIDVLRAARPSTSIDDRDDIESLIAEGSTTARPLEFEELETLRICLGEMKSDTRKFVMLAYYDGFSRDELAERFNMPVGTVKTKLRRGLMALKACLEQ